MEPCKCVYRICGHSPRLEGNLWGRWPTEFVGAGVVSVRAQSNQTLTMTPLLPGARPRVIRNSRIRSSLACERPWPTRQPNKGVRSSARDFVGPFVAHLSDLDFRIVEGQRQSKRLVLSDRRELSLVAQGNVTMFRRTCTLRAAQGRDSAER